MAGRSLHRSQDMGRLQGLGPSRVPLALIEDRTGAGGEFFAGVDTALSLGGDIPRGAAVNPQVLLDLRRQWSSASVPPDQLAHLDRAIVAAAGVVCDARSDDDRVTPGQRIGIVLECWNTGTSPHTVDASLVGGRAIEADTARATLRLAPGALLSRRLDASVRADAPPTAPYFRLPGGDTAVYDWSRAEPSVRGEPSGPPELIGRFVLDGLAVVEREVTFRLNDQARGEIRRPVAVVPRVELAVDPGTAVWPSGDRSLRRFTVTLGHGARDTTAGTLALELPKGWPAVTPQPFRLVHEDERETSVFDIRPPASPIQGTVPVRAVATDARGRRYVAGLVTVDYPHIRPRSLVRPAVALVRMTPLRLPPVTRLGYVRGAADRVPEALAQAGLPVTLLDAATLERGDLSRFDAIVVGPRAYETDSALVEANGRLVAYARHGGLVVVQYQQQAYFNGGFAPYPMTVGGPPLTPGGFPVSHDRVTDETAPVHPLAPSEPILLGPNRITDADWRGWTQERGLYFARSWDHAYRPVLETHDPGEPPLEGGLLVAHVGRGNYVYTGLSFFRQLPAGVPGAFRLFANLLAIK
jgi:hypothetical protein